MFSDDLVVDLLTCASHLADVVFMVLAARIYGRRRRS